MTSLCAKTGYRNIDVDQLVARAGVARDDYDQLFANKEECFLAAMSTAATRLLEDVREAMQISATKGACEAIASAMAKFSACRQPDARLIFWESLRGGAQIRRERRLLLDELAVTLDHARREAPYWSIGPDLPSRLICSNTARLLGRRLRRRQPLDEPSAEIIAWLRLYEAPTADHRWSSLIAPRIPKPSPFLPRGRLGVPSTASASSKTPSSTTTDDEWLRMVFATAELIHRVGYEAATTEEILHRSKVDRRTFEATFPDKRDAFLAAQGMLFRHLTAASAGAFATGDSWATRLWEAVRALTQCAEQNAMLTQVSLLESCASGEDGNGLAQDVTAAFAMFLREGDQARRAGYTTVPDGLLDAVIAGIAELAVEQIEADPEAPLTDLFARVVFLCTAPFIGGAAATELALQPSSAPAAATR
ncbi:MAG TPA: TetR family transcriptional regulator [Solirubrobacteraceae bacterium]|jgi:AcrR family transcriptional regulator|nr:TetR family transcriptional regulator [Solirubrobacteraceae bacterium]